MRRDLRSLQPRCKNRRTESEDRSESQPSRASGAFLAFAANEPAGRAKLNTTGKSGCENRTEGRRSPHSVRCCDFQDSILGGSLRLTNMFAAESPGARIEPRSFRSRRSLHSLIRFRFRTVSSLECSQSSLAVRLLAKDARRKSGCENRTEARRSLSLRSSAATGRLRSRLPAFPLLPLVVVKKSGCENRTRVSASTRLKDNHYPNPDTCAL